MRRAKGEVGPALVDSSSSTALSSIESELVVEILPRLIPNGVLAELGEAPDRPSVVTDSLRRWSLAAAELPFPADVELLRWNRLEKAAEVTEARRSPLLELSLDILAGCSS